MAGYHLLLGAVLFPEEFETYKAEVRKLGEARNMMERWISAFCAWFTRDANYG
jgi:hypothetical protein